MLQRSIGRIFEQAITLVQVIFVRCSKKTVKHDER